LFALSLEFFNNLIFVKFGKILTKYDLFCLMLILLFVNREGSGIGETRAALGDRLTGGLPDSGSFLVIYCVLGIHKAVRRGARAAVSEGAVWKPCRPPVRLAQQGDDVRPGTIG